MAHSRIIILLSVVLALSSQAQNQRPPAVVGKVPSPANRPALNDLKVVQDILQPKMTGRDLADHYTKFTGRRVIVTNAAVDSEFYCVIKASPENPLTYAEAAELLRKTAVLGGFVFTQHRDDPNLDILTVVSSSTRPTNININVYSEGSKLPEKDVVITYVMALNYIKPDQAVQVFTGIIGQLGAYGSIYAVPNASAVVITEKASLIKSLIELKQTIDVPGSVQATRFIQVEHADAAEVAAVLNELMAAQQSAQALAGVQRAPQTAPGDNAAPANNAGASGISTPVQIVADSRTNRIFAMGRPVDLVFVENLVGEFDIPASEKTFLQIGRAHV